MDGSIDRGSSQSAPPRSTAWRMCCAAPPSCRRSLTAIALQPWALGARAVPAAALTLLAVLVLVEVVLLDWARVPYTCSYLPGKRVMAYTLGVLFAAYAVFVYLGAQSIRWGALHPSRTLVVGGLLLATFAALRRARMRTWGVQPLEFEDVDPAAPQAAGTAAGRTLRMPISPLRLRLSRRLRRRRRGGRGSARTRRDS